MTGEQSRIGVWAVTSLAGCAMALGGCGGSPETGSTEVAVVAQPLASPVANLGEVTVADDSPLDARQRPAAIPAPASGYSIEFDPPILDMGYVAPNRDATGSIEMRNTGSRPIRILSVKPSCKCTTLEDLTGRVIQPGESIPLKASLDGRAVTGVRTATITVVFDGIPEPQQVELRAEGTMAVRVMPGILNLGSGDTTGHVAVESIDGRPFNILAANRQPPRFVDFDPDLDEPQSKYVLQWDLTEEESQRRLQRWWVIETDHPDCPLTDAWIRHLTTIERPPRDRPWSVPGRRSLIGLIERGGFADFTVDIKNIPASDAIYAVRSLSADFNAELLGFERDGVNGVCTIRVVPRSEFTGLLYGRVELLASTYTHGQDVIGKVQ